MSAAADRGTVNATLTGLARTIEYAAAARDRQDWERLSELADAISDDARELLRAADRMANFGDQD